MIINAQDTILGRLASYVAKKALLGENVEIVNCEKAVITGGKKNILEKYKARVKRGNPFKGPYFPRRADMIVRRAIRGMLPRKKARGRDAYKNIKCYLGIPENLKNETFITLEEVNINKVKPLKFIYLNEISKMFGR
ncbi:MAG: 50S ribosomal protein L13 [Nanoarchaeota archaeon]